MRTSYDSWSGPMSVQFVKMLQALPYELCMGVCVCVCVCVCGEIFSLLKLVGVTFSIPLWLLLVYASSLLRQRNRSQNPRPPLRLGPPENTALMFVP